MTQKSCAVGMRNAKPGNHLTQLNHDCDTQMEFFTTETFETFNLRQYFFTVNGFEFVLLLTVTSFLRS